jgi:hypothetical protein
MPFTDRAYYDGQDHPRCQASPGALEVLNRPELGGGTWECALPAGHEDLDNPRLHPHSWAQTGE